MDLPLQDKVVIITGGSSNIGRAISFSFIQAGSKIVIADIDTNQSTKVKEEALKKKS